MLEKSLQGIRSWNAKRKFKGAVKAVILTNKLKMSVVRVREIMIMAVILTNKLKMSVVRRPIFSSEERKLVAYSFNCRGLVLLHIAPSLFFFFLSIPISSRLTQMGKKDAAADAAAKEEEGAFGDVEVAPGGEEA